MREEEERGTNPVVIVQPPLAVNTPEVVNSRLLPVRLAPLAQVTVLKEDKAVLKVTGPATIRAPVQEATGVHEGTPPPPPI